MFGAEGDDTSAVAVVALTLKTKQMSCHLWWAEGGPGKAISGYKITGVDDSTSHK